MNQRFSYSKKKGQAMVGVVELQVFGKEHLVASPDEPHRMHHSKIIFHVGVGVTGDSDSASISGDCGEVAEWRHVELMKVHAKVSEGHPGSILTSCLGTNSVSHMNGETKRVGPASCLYFCLSNIISHPKGSFLYVYYILRIRVVTLILEYKA